MCFIYLPLRGWRGAGHHPASTWTWSFPGLPRGAPSPQGNRPPVPPVEWSSTGMEWNGMEWIGLEPPKQATAVKKRNGYRHKKKKNAEP